jgi:hypothetical protein
MPDIIAQLRAEVLKFAWHDAEVLDTVLDAVDAVPYLGDDHLYITEAMAALTAACKVAMQPVLAAAQAEADAARAHGDLLQAQFERSQREFEVFRRMETFMTIQ